MSSQLALAKESFFVSTSLEEASLSRVIGSLMSNQVDSADLYFQATTYETWVLENGIIKEGNYGIDKGVGVRAISGEKSGYAYTDNIALPNLLEAAAAAKSIAKAGNEQQVAINQTQAIERVERYAPLNPTLSLTNAEKVSLLKSIDKAARGIDNRVTEVTVALAGSFDTVLVIGSDDTYEADVRPMVRLSVAVVVESNGRKEEGSASAGGRVDFKMYTSGLGLELAQEAVRKAVTNLDSIAAPAGMMPVVLGPGWPGVLLHEAIGHGLEGDFNRKGTSAFAGRIGERVASPLCTVVDDGTLVNQRGSLSIDDEGTASRCTTLIENGILRGYMQDKLNAKLMGVAPTGNGRRQSYRHLPMPRMTNTYMLAGQSHPEEIIASVKKGIYAVNFGGGQVDITSGKFVFNANEAYLIEDGKVTKPVKGANLIGNGPDVLTKVSMVGNDLALDKGYGTCGKDGQTVPVCVGQPTLKVDEITVGGTN